MSAWAERINTSVQSYRWTPHSNKNQQFTTLHTHTRMNSQVWWHRAQKARNVKRHPGVILFIPSPSITSQCYQKTKVVLRSPRRKEGREERGLLESREAQRPGEGNDFKSLKIIKARRLTIPFLQGYVSSNHCWGEGRWWGSVQVWQGAPNL